MHPGLVDFFLTKLTARGGSEEELTSGPVNLQNALEGFKIDSARHLPIPLGATDMKRVQLVAHPEMRGRDPFPPSAAPFGPERGVQFREVDVDSARLTAIVACLRARRSLLRYL